MMRVLGLAFARLSAGALLVVALSASVASAEDVDIHGLAGTLVMPDTQAPLAAAVIIAGSGPTDRNGNSHLGLKTDAYRLLAEALAARGIATLRYDKRGIGGSAQFVRPEHEIVFEHFIADVVLVGRWLQERVAKPVVLIGHSEGGTLALMAAERLKSAGIVLLAAPGRTLGTVMREQYSRPGASREIAAEAMTIIAALERGEDVAEVNPRLALAFRPSVQPYLRSSIGLDPSAVARELKLPLMVVGGGRDFQIGKSDFDALCAARPDAVAYWDSDMAHTLKSSRSDAQSVQRAYTDPRQPLAVGLASRVADFIVAAQP